MRLAVHLVKINCEATIMYHRRQYSLILTSSEMLDLLLARLRPLPPFAYTSHVILADAGTSYRTRNLETTMLLN